MGTEALHLTQLYNLDEGTSALDMAEDSQDTEQPSGWTSAQLQQVSLMGLCSEPTKETVGLRSWKADFFFNF